MQTQTKDSDLMLIISSIIGYILAFNFYVTSLISNSTLVNDKINEVVSAASVEIKSLNSLLILISSIIAIITLLIYFLINKIILTFLHTEISSSKLLLTLLIASIPAPLVGSFMYSITAIDPMNIIVRSVLSLFQPIIIFFLLNDSFEKKKNSILYLTILLLLTLFNIITSYSIL